MFVKVRSAKDLVAALRKLVFLEIPNAKNYLFSVVVYIDVLFISLFNHSGLLIQTDTGATMFYIS